MPSPVSREPCRRGLSIQSITATRHSKVVSTAGIGLVVRPLCYYNPGEPMPTVDDTTTWDRAPGATSLLGNEVHVWLARLDQPAAMVAKCRTILSGDERIRADRFHFERDRTAYTIARAVLK